eukprot:TRINITY_DN4843_c0_g1_i14.p2 TRINITY_DN4843_c0_g1~~TRINITY_DN4843_c0_g1_i14.p2  ORF type:complete len:211 (-),score=48.01 TRINITY_DN4843_c0_g1_i14:212-844(-)
MRTVFILIAVLVGVVSATFFPSGGYIRKFNWTRTKELLKGKGKIVDIKNKAKYIMNLAENLFRKPIDEEFPGRKRRLGEPSPTFPRIPKPIFLSEFVNKRPTKGGKFGRTSPTFPKAPKIIALFQDHSHSQRLKRALLFQDHSHSKSLTLAETKRMDRQHQSFQRLQRSLLSQKSTKALSFQDHSHSKRSTSVETERMASQLQSFQRFHC